MKVTKGYWRFTDDTTNILECLLSSKGCMGGWEVLYTLISIIYEQYIKYSIANITIYHLLLI
jgi:ABC-type tungstate transport system substrate-binding protein